MTTIRAMEQRPARACRRAGAALVLLTLLALGSAAVAGASTIAGFNRETYSFQSSLSPAQEAARYQVLVLQATSASAIPQLKAANPNLKVLMYQGIMAAQDSSPQYITCTTGTSDIASHPSWILKDQNGNPILAQGHYLMDVGNAGYQQACLSGAIALAKQKGFDGVYWDMVNASLSYTLPSGTSVPQYPTLSSWQSAMGSMLTYAGAQLHASGLLAVANMGGVASYKGLWQQWNTPLDGSEEESWTDGKLGTVQQLPWWASKLANVAWSEANRKITILHSWNSTEAGNAYGLASMLLVATGNSSYSTSNNCYTTCEVWYPEYTSAQQLGAPVGAYTQLSNGVYERAFQNGIVLVNPTAHAVSSFSLGGGTYTGSNLTSVSSVSMAPTTGLVLLADQTSTSPSSTAPASQAAPAISGTATAGGALTASPGTWSGTPTPSLAYQWDRCGTTSMSSCLPIAGATASTYVVQAADAGSYLTVVVKAANAAGTASATSARSSQVPTPSFGLTMWPVTSRNIGRGEYTWIGLSVPGLSGVATPVTLSVSGLPSGATYTFNTPTTNWQDCLNVWTSKSSPAGTYNVVVSGSAGGLTRTATLTLTLR